MYYAVANGHIKGVFNTWEDCKKSVYKFPNAKYKKFKNKEDATAFVNEIDEIDEIDEIESEHKYFIYTDGACSNNGKVNAKAGYGIFFQVDDERNVSKKITGKQTNNVAELTAVIDAINIIENDASMGGRIGIVTDSEYVIKCVNGYGEKCYNTGWSMSIPNRELIMKLYNLSKKYKNLDFIHIRAHTGLNDKHSIGNMWADKLARNSIS